LQGLDTPRLEARCRVAVWRRRRRQVRAVEVRHSGAGAGTGVQTVGSEVSRQELQPARRKKQEDRRPI
jgi:hypothetical protein